MCSIHSLWSSLSFKLSVKLATLRSTIGSSMVHIFQLTNKEMQLMTAGDTNEGIGNQMLNAHKSVLKPGKWNRKLSRSIFQYCLISWRRKEFIYIEKITSKCDVYNNEHNAFRLEKFTF